MKRILLISYHFPPSNAVGGIRIANFAKTLARFGWDPVVLTVKDKHIEHIDLERLKEIKDIRIVKAGKSFKLSHIYLAMKKYLHFAGDDPDKISIEPQLYGGKINSSNSETISGKFKRYSLAFLSLPDPERNWILLASIKAIQEIRKNDIDCILTSCPPYSAHLVGLLVKKLTGVKWIADYRDPWLISGVKSVFHTCKLSLSIEQWIEERVIYHADTVLSNTRNLSEAYRQRYASEKNNKFVYLPNMIDTKLYDGFRRMEKYPEFTISYTGSLYLGRTPEPLFQAVQELLKEGKIRNGDIRIKLVGNCDRINGDPITAAIEYFGLGSTVEVSGLVPHAKSLEIIRRSHLALLLAPAQPLQIPAKVYEYMGLGTTVLAIAKNGATKDLLNSVRGGRAFDSSEIEGIKEFLLESIANGEPARIEDNKAAVEEFEVSTVVRRLSSELDKLYERDNSTA